LTHKEKNKPKHHTKKEDRRGERCAKALQLTGKKEENLTQKMRNAKRATIKRKSTSGEERKNFGKDGKWQGMYCATTWAVS